MTGRTPPWHQHIQYPCVLLFPSPLGLDQRDRLGHPNTFGVADHLQRIRWAFDRVASAASRGHNLCEAQPGLSGDAWRATQQSSGLLESCHFRPSRRHFATLLRLVATLNRFVTRGRSASARFSSASVGGGSGSRPSQQASFFSFSIFFGSSGFCACRLVFRLALAASASLVLRLLGVSHYRIGRWRCFVLRAVVAGCLGLFGRVALLGCGNRGSCGRSGKRARTSSGAQAAATAGVTTRTESSALRTFLKSAWGIRLLVTLVKYVGPRTQFFNLNELQRAVKTRRCHRIDLMPSRLADYTCLYEDRCRSVTAIATSVPMLPQRLAGTWPFPHGSPRLRPGDSLAVGEAVCRVLPSRGIGPSSRLLGGSPPLRCL